MKKTWIKIKRGILAPEHRQKLGIRVWLFMYMLDITDWDTGRIEGWTDADAAKDLDMPKSTVIKQRQQLETDGYIVCRQGMHSQTITIANWVNPREYSGEVYNEQGTQNWTPSDEQGTQNLSPYPSSKLDTLYQYPHLKNHIYTYPDHLFTPSFLKIWDDFHEHRKQIKKKMTSLAGERALAKLAKCTEQDAIQMLERSIENGWTGVFELPKTNGRQAVPTNKNLPEGI